MKEFGADAVTTEDLPRYRDSSRLGYHREWITTMHERFKFLNANEIWSNMERCSVGHDIYPIRPMSIFSQERILIVL